MIRQSLTRVAVSRTRAKCTPDFIRSRAAARAELSTDSSRATIPWVSPSGTSHFHPLFLRDHCLCPICTHEETRQRLTHTSSIPFDLQPKKYAPTAEGLAVTWPDGHESFFPTAWLQTYSYGTSDDHTEASTPQKRLWTAKEIRENAPSVDYDSVMQDDRSLLTWLQHIETTGLCFVDNTPPNPQATENLARRIAFIRETHYGTFWDFTANLEHADTAYTNIALGLHTDSTYFSDPVGLQMFHLLSDRSTHKGGHSILSDGFAAAKRLREAHPALYALLSSLPIPTHASGGDSARFEPLVHRPILEHDHLGNLSCVRYNNDDRAPVGRGPAWRGTVDLSTEGLGKEVDKVPAFYFALRKWDEIVHDPEMVWEFPMQPGKPFIFDNKRVLHGRTSFSGERRLCGAYINGDDYHSRRKSLAERYS